MSTMRHLLLLALGCMHTAFAAELSPQERKHFLDAIRPEAARMAGQPVRFKVDVLNADSGWALLVGELAPVEGSRLDWSKARNCEPTLDKLLWVVAKQERGNWKVSEMLICAPEPPYWNLDDSAFARPCGLYAGLAVSEGKTAEDVCRARASRRKADRR
jgi:hypothetical protein